MEGGSVFISSTTPQLNNSTHHKVFHHKTPHQIYKSQRKQQAHQKSKKNYFSRTRWGGVLLVHSDKLRLHVGMSRLLMVSPENLSESSPQGVPPLGYQGGGPLRSSRFVRRRSVRWRPFWL